MGRRRRGAGGRGVVRRRRSWKHLFSIHEIEDKINADVMPGKHVSLSDRAWHAIQDEHRSVFVLDLASTLDDLNGHLIADEVTTTECLA